MSQRPRHWAERKAERWPPNSWPPSTTAPPVRAASSSTTRARPIAMAQRAQTMHYPRPGWVELDMDEVWQRTQECIHEALGSAGAAPADVAGDRDHERARDRRLVGSTDGSPGRTVDHLAGHTDGRRRRRARGRRGHPSVPRSHRPADLDVLVCAEACVAARPGPDQAGGGQPWGPPVRHAGHLAPVEPHGWPERRGARDGPDERKPHPPDEPGHARMGRRPTRTDGDPACASSRDPLFERGVRHRGRRLVRRTSRGRPRRPAGFAVRSHVLRPR